MVTRSDFNEKTTLWLQEQGIVPEESFITALKAYAEEYRRENNIRHLENVYSKIGIRKADFSYWRAHPDSTQSKKF